MIDNISVGNQIKFLRRQNGFTQEELAAQLGISPQAISKWENGHTLPETALLPLLAKLLNSSIDSILMPGGTATYGESHMEVIRRFRENEMRHTIEQKEPFQIIGRTRYMTLASEFWHDIAAMWDEWYCTGLAEQVEAKHSSDPPGHCINISFAAPTAKDSKRFAYSIGCIYNGAANEDGYDIATLPGGTYAVFSIPRSYAENVGDFMAKIMYFLEEEGHDFAHVEVEYFPGCEWNENWEAWIMIKQK